MKNRLPPILQQIRICIICEGSEEYEYLDKLKKLDVWNRKYAIRLENADGNGMIPARYQDKYQNGTYDIVLIFCDTDKKPYEQYMDIKHKIDDFHGIKGAAEMVIIYRNPCTMQIIITHWKEILLNSPAKKINAPIIEECTGVTNYKARSDQREEIFRQISRENYRDMLIRIKKFVDDDTIVASSNFGKFMDYFTTDDDTWVEEINKVLDGCS
jgi:hypothetical protein